MSYNASRFLTVTLPYPPTQNQSLKARVNKTTMRPQFYDTKEVKDWRAKAEKACAEAHEELHSIFMDEPVEVHISVYPPDNRCDIDGIEKKVLDVLQGVAYHNDRQVYGKRTERTLGVYPDNPRVVVRVWEFGKPWPLGYNLSPNHFP